MKGIILIFIVASAVNASMIQGLSNPGTKPGLLNLFNLPPIDKSQQALKLECFVEPFTIKDRCRQQLSGVTLTRLGTGIYSFQTDQKVNWYQAKDWCKAHGMDLVTIDNAAEDQLISNYLYNYYVSNGIPRGFDSFFWIGLNDLGKSGTFTWDSNGQQLSGFTNWLPGQPDNPTTEFCVEYWYNQDVTTKPQWNNRDCAGLYTGPFICELNSACRCHI